MSIDPFDPGSGRGYHVYPEALRVAAADVMAAAELLDAFSKIDLVDTVLGEHDLGLPGMATRFAPGVNGVGVVDSYNNTVAQIKANTIKNFGALRFLADALRSAAAFYEQQDEEFYEKLKAVEGGMK